MKKIAQKIIPWGFSGLSLFEVSSFFWKGLVNGSITTRASSLAFNFFLAFFPSIIVFFTLIPYVPINGLQETLMEIISTVLPESTNEMTFKTLDDIINNQRGGLLSIGFILALYFSTNGVNSLIEALNASFHIKEVRTILRQKILSIGLTLLLSSMLIITIILIILSKTTILFISEFNIITNSSLNIIIYGKWLIMLIMLLFGISIIFSIAPAYKQKWKILTPGTILTTFFIILSSVIFNYYIYNFSLYNQIYGSIGTLMIILIWMYFNSLILLIGFELNVTIATRKKITKTHN